MNCKNCKHWEVTEELKEGNEWLAKEENKCEVGYCWQSETPYLCFDGDNGVFSSDSEPLFPANFGCIHFELEEIKTI